MIVHLNGRLGADAEVKSGKNGNQFLSMRVATDEFKNGNKGTAWFNVVAEANDRNMKLVQYLTKGKMVNIVGTETVDLFTNKNGEPQISRDIRAFNIDFVNIGSKENAEGSVTTSTQTTTPIQVNEQVPPMSCGTFAKPQPSAAATSSTDDDDLPF